MKKNSFLITLMLIWLLPKLNSQYSQIFDQLDLSIQNHNKTKILIDSFQNGSLEYNYLYGDQIQVNPEQICDLLKLIRMNKNYDSIGILEQKYFLYWPIHRINWNQAYSSMGINFEKYKNLLVSFRMTFVEFEMSKLGWSINAKYEYLKSQIILSTFQDRFDAFKREKFNFPNGEKPFWYSEFDTSQLYRIQVIDSVLSLFPKIYNNNFGRLLVLESMNLLSENFINYEKYIFDDLEKSDFLVESKLIGKDEFNFDLLSILTTTNELKDTNRLNKILSYDVLRYDQGGKFFEKLLYQYANPELIIAYAKEVSKDCSYEKWKYGIFQPFDQRSKFICNKVGFYVLEHSKKEECKFKVLNGMISINSEDDKDKLSRILKHENDFKVKQKIRSFLKTN
ncbi:MAG: hypothetical protein IPL98_11185 [Saprospiraceae bacterium]|nr:hypothetical protein [Saprospiraceae bacterium]